MGVGMPGVLVVFALSVVKTAVASVVPAVVVEFVVVVTVVFVGSVAVVGSVASGVFVVGIWLSVLLVAAATVVVVVVLLFVGAVTCVDVFVAVDVLVVV